MKYKKEDDLCVWLYKTYVNELFSYGTALGVTRMVLQDAIQDVFLHFMENGYLLNEVNNVKFYLFRSLKNRLISLTRRSKSFENLDEEFDYEFSLKVTGVDLMIEEEERQRLIKRVDELLACLTNRQREAIYLRYIQELSYEEIGELLAMTPKASRKLVSRALIRIRENNFSLVLFLSILKNALF
ncbi:MAG: sigma-70 family RNA polymerase sigma factor [Massilibacteroides sp.]|nr:sigma-70 family RNA polymerase sigma factor [Massilibacteroides sp.]